MSLSSEFCSCLDSFPLLSPWYNFEENPVEALLSFLFLAESSAPSWRAVQVLGNVGTASAPLWTFGSRFLKAVPHTKPTQISLFCFLNLLLGGKEGNSSDCTY